MKIHNYLSDDDYRLAQERANLRKISKVWVRESTIDAIVARVPAATGVICHGTRNGAEQQFFAARYPGAEIIGTEIAKTATRFPMTVQWDFRKPNPNWFARFDILYSNSIDHTNEPQQTLCVWRDQLANGGTLVIEFAHDPENNRARSSDPLEMSLAEIETLFANSGLEIVDQIDERHDMGTSRIYFLQRAHG
jgi:trans-aconitate methyltransferase